MGYPGSVHDARVFRRNELHRRIIAGDIMGGTRVINHVNVRPYLVGDTAYPLSPFLVTAFQGGRLTLAQERFNRMLTKLCVVMERVLGKLKTRWRCIFKELEEIQRKLRLMRSPVAFCTVSVLLWEMISIILMKMMIAMTKMMKTEDRTMLEGRKSDESSLNFCQDGMQFLHVKQLHKKSRMEIWFYT